ncbi:MAG: tRNA (adenosine(37)-N6)-threonylcarbamoyltransferase complex ATPase subunit type 1 TsaE [Halothiobacillaceae bacterium]|nr:tRNA (adenosine(37)-N6)-threonylcarbamoyltransferase complex ATPase subunit type 1 TsaE [Halothiobacillaceae bacterium]
MYLPDEAATQALGAALAHTAPAAGWMALHGDLGAGKTTLVRAFLRALGYAGRVVSPTYTLVESYDIGARRIAHYDLYRLNDPEELEWMGARDDFGGDTLCLVEWPERGEKMLPPADLDTYLRHDADARRASVQAHSPAGRLWLEQVHQELKKNNISCSLN